MKLGDYARAVFNGFNGSVEAPNASRAVIGVVGNEIVV